ncbi:MAG: protein kinase [Polyangiaceae bacterium]|nr:protein kinase [Polyangiaceae bacterium]
MRATKYLEGDVIEGKYRLVRTIGEGGMGVVWMARNLVLNVDVALKLIHGVWANENLLGRRFLQEARTAAQLAHPAICRVFDYGRTYHGDPFIVSELLEGETLGRLIERDGRLPGARAVQTILPVMDGLVMAHTTGILHRDVKSDNIFLAQDLAGRVQPKLLDFGVARFVNEDHKITADGCPLGTPDYMSPEQARGEGGADFRTDIWSMSVVLYELLTARTPFLGENYNAVMYAILNEAVLPITELNAGNESLWRLLERGLAKDPLERWESMRVFGINLAAWLYEHGVREDISGTSLRATWLASTADRASLIPLAKSSVPPALDLPSLPDPPGDITKATVPGLVSSAARRGRPRPWTTAIAAAVAVLLVITGVWIGAAFFTRSSPSAQAEGEGSPGLSERDSAASRPTAAAADTGPAASVPAATSPSASPSAADANAERGMEGRAAPKAPTPRSPAGRSPRSAPNPRRRPDFGF